MVDPHTWQRHTPGHAETLPIHLEGNIMKGKFMGKPIFSKQPCKTCQERLRNGLAVSGC